MRTGVSKKGVMHVSLRIIVAALAWGGVLLEPAPAAAQAVPNTTELIALPGQDGITREVAQQRIGELESVTDPDDGQRARLIETYRQIVQRLETRLTNAERTEAFRAAIESAPLEVTRLRTELAAARAAAPKDTVLDPAATADGLQQRLTQVQAELTELRTQLADLDRRIGEERERPAKAEQQRAEVRTTLAQLAVDLAAPEPTPDAPESVRAARGLLIARHRSRTVELAMLEQELLSNPARVLALEALRDLTVWRVADAEARAVRVEGWLSQVRRTEADRARMTAERLSQEATGKNALIVMLTGQIAETTRATQQLLHRSDELRAERQKVDERLSRTEEDLRETKRSMDLGITGSLGTVLLERRRQLPSARSLQRAAAERAGRVAAERLKLFTDEREIKALADPARVIEGLMKRPEAVGLDATNDADVLTELLEKKTESLTQLQKARQDHLNLIGNLEAREAALLSVARELAAILDERLLWIPNAPPVSRATFGRLGGDLVWLSSSSLWSQALDALTEDFEALTAGYALFGLALLGLWVLRIRMRTRLQAIAGLVGKVRTDSILLTIQALVLLALRTAPLPAAAALLGWRLGRAGASTDLSKAIGVGLITAAVVGFVLQFLRELCRESGIARAHFHWGKRTDRLVRRELLWFLAAAIPTGFVVALIQQQPDGLLRFSLGRLTFIVLMLATAVLGYRLLHPRKGLYLAADNLKGSAWLRLTRPIWLPLGVLGPLVLGALAASGYYYAALQLEIRLNQTVLIILAALFLHAFLLRWLQLSQRRLSKKLADEKRAAALKSQEGAEGLAEGAEYTESADEIDMFEIKEQTKDLLRVVIGFLVLIGFYLAWVSVLPALGVLNQVELWDHTAMVDGVATQVSTTLASLGMALLLIVITVTAARNMPGFLEIAVLQRLPLDAGARYATRTLTFYVIVATGIVLAFNSLGVGWSSVQWLVAALTVGLGFGLQEIFANFVSGLIILLERPVRVGDTVTVANVSGVVSRIRMRATTITDWKRRELVVPNKAFITNELINWSLSDPIMRLDFVVGIAYGSDTTLAHQTMLDVARRHPMVLDQPEPTVFFIGFGDNSLEFEVRIFVSESSNTGRTRILHDLHMAVDQACRDQQITIAFPQRDLHFKSSETVLRVALEPDESGKAGNSPSA